jgi:hypothetical protein
MGESEEGLHGILVAGVARHRARPITGRVAICALLGAGVLVARPGGVSASPQDCGPTITTRVAVEVYADPPRYSTRDGWTLGERHGQLAAGTSVQLCERRAIGFVFSRRTWFRIRYQVAESWHEGWIFGEGTTTAAAAAASRGGLLAFLAATPAHAQPELGLPSPTPSDLSPMALMFIAVLLGMVGKGAYDYLLDGAPKNVRAYAAKTLAAVIVSPIVFLGINSLGDFQIESQRGLWLYLFLAFQNGFFWQTVIAKAGPAIRHAHPKAGGG